MARKTCVLRENQRCTQCGECNICDLDPTKICDNCMKCLHIDDADYKAITIENIQKTDSEYTDMLKTILERYRNHHESDSSDED